MLAVGVALALSVLLMGCSTPGFDEDAMKALAERTPMDLDSEQVTLTGAQVNCGVNADLWEASAGGDGRFIYRLTQKARDLQFTDDVYDRDPEYPTPYSQVRGKFNLALVNVVSVREGTEKGTKLVRATLGIRLNHFCFPEPLLIMGINKGRFTTQLAPTLLYQNGEEGWSAVKLMH